MGALAMPERLPMRPLSDGGGAAAVGSPLPVGVPEQLPPQQLGGSHK